MSSTADDSGFDMISWPDEAAAVINDVQQHVREIFISSILPSTEIEIYLNCETLEGRKCTIRLSGDGFQIVSNSYDRVDHLNGFPYETPYALLNEISVGYTASFGNQLTKALSNLVHKNE